MIVYKGRNILLNGRYIIGMSKKSEALSPWGMSPAEYVEVSPLEGAFDAKIAIPGSKSYTNRALVIAAVAKGASKLGSPLFSDDSYWCCDALRKLGVNVSPSKSSGYICVENIMGGALKQSDGKEVPYIGSAGTIARFLPGIIAARGEGEVTLTSSDQLAKRPVLEMIRALRELGAQIDMEGGASFPMRIQGGSLRGGQTQISGSVSSQFISGILIAAPLAKEPVTLKVTDHIVQEDYVRITLDVMKDFGVNVDVNADFTEFKIQPQDYIGGDIQLEADASTATCFFALATASNSKLTITNLNPNTLQPDFGFIEHLKTVGADIRIDQDGVHLSGPAEIKGDLIFDFNPCSDSTPAMITIAPFAKGDIEVRNVAHIRAHECDRLAVLAKNLKAANISVEEYQDGLKVSPGRPERITVDPHDDHRMAMSFAVMGALSKGIKILDPSCVSKTCSEYYDLLNKIGIKCVAHRKTDTAQ